MLNIRKVQELDLVEVLEDFPKYNVKKGEIGVVIEALDNPDEAYDLEFVDESGTSSRFAYSVKPEQIRSVDETAREALERGINLHNEGRGVEAEVEFRQAIELKPNLIEELHNRIVKSFEIQKNLEEAETLERFIFAMRLVLRLSPNYAVARSNLAIAYENQGVQAARKGNYGVALTKFVMALAVGASNEVTAGVKRNLATAYTQFGLQAFEVGNLDESLGYMEMACQVDSNETTRRNFGAAYAHLGWSFLKKREYKNAIRAFEHSIDIGLETEDILNNLGIAFAKSGELGRAIWKFERALKIAPNNNVVEANLRVIRKAILEGGAAEDLRLEDVSAEFDTVLSIETQSYRTAA